MKNKGMFEQIYRLVAMIPRGKVATYGQLAVLVGMPRAARLVGWAMASVPYASGLPCHRVVNRLGGLAPPHIFGGLQRQILEEEGVVFLQNGMIDMKSHLFDWAGIRDE